jgi:hypothetical protein
LFACRYTYKLEFLTADVGDIHVVGRGREIFQLLAGEDVDGDQVDLSVTMLASLRSGHLDNLAGAALDDNVTVLPQSRALHGESGGGASIGGLEGVLMLLITRQRDCPALLTFATSALAHVCTHLRIVVGGFSHVEEVVWCGGNVVWVQCSWEAAEMHDQVFVGCV